MEKKENERTKKKYVTERLISCIVRRFFVAALLPMSMPQKEKKLKRSGKKNARKKKS